MKILFISGEARSLGVGALSLGHRETSQHPVIRNQDEPLETSARLMFGSDRIVIHIFCSGTKGDSFLWKRHGLI